MRKKYLSKSPAQTRELGKILAKEALKTKPEKGLVVGLEGDLGGGKTTFLQGLAKGLGIKEKTLSPTFIILKRFRIPARNTTQSVAGGKDLRFKCFYHIDCYRIEKPREILDLGFKEIISNPQNIIAIEWAEKIRKTVPEEAIWVEFEFIDKTTRKIVLK